MSDSVPKNTLLDIIKNLLTSLSIEDKLIKIKLDLSPELISVLNKIISATPDFFNEIEKSVIEIVKDEKINSRDIPQFIIIVQKIYENIYKLKSIKYDSKKRIEIAKQILKFVIHLLVIEEVIKIDKDNQDEFLSDCDILIDACIGLLSFAKSIKIKGCMKKIFG